MMRAKSKGKKRLASLLAVASLVCSGIALSTILPAQTEALGAAISDEVRAQSGISFPTAADQYVTVKKYAETQFVPKTYEAYVMVPESYAGKRAGILYGNYSGENKKLFNFEMQAGSDKIYPKLHFDAGSGSTTFTFSGEDVAVGEYVHIAVTLDAENRTATCYLNGVASTTVNANNTKVASFDYSPSSNALAIGGDFRSGNAQNFKGNIKGLKFYSDVRTAQEIAADYGEWVGDNAGTIDVSDEDLICAYDFTQAGRGYLTDLSENGYNLAYSGDAYDDVDGMSFTDAETFYEVNKMYATLPNTIEAEVFLPTLVSARAGVIVGNWSNDSVASIGFEIAANGVPRFRYNTAAGVVNDYSFHSVDVRTGDWAHVTVVHDKNNNETACYLDGVKLQSVAYSDYPTDAMQTFYLGGDHRANNAQNFKGFIRSVALFEDARTAEEVALDAKNGVNGADGLLAHYQMPASATGKDVPDLTGNGYDARYERLWIDPVNKTPVTDYAYSFAVVGDTQCINELEPERFAGMYDWIVENAESKKIAHVFGLGDITQSVSSESAAVEWDKAVEVIKKLEDAKISYSLVRGNHDDTVLFNEHFHTQAYKAQFAGFYEEDKIDSAWQTFTVGGHDYLHVILDYGADDEELAWAGKVIESFPNHKVIVTTHAYMYRDGTTLSINDVCSPADSNDWSVDPYKVYNNGDQMWEKLISRYGNIFLVLSGHDPCEDVVTRQTKGVHGNTVTQMLIDPQAMDSTGHGSGGCVGMICMLYFNEDGTQIEVEWYSTVKDQFFKYKNQYTVDVTDATTTSHAVGNCSYDSEKHWCVCSDCGAKYAMEGHTYGEWVVTPATATAEGYRTKTCECGHEVKEVLTSYEFGNVYGASIRVGKTNGIRFTMQLSDAKKREIFGENSGLTLGMYIFPEHLLASANGDYASITHKYTLTFDESDLYREGDFWYVKGAITDLLLQDFATRWIGIGYIAATDGEHTAYTYSTFVQSSNVRSIFDVAVSAYLDETETVDKNLLLKYVEMGIYAKYGICEVRTTEGGVTTVTYQKGTQIWDTYDEMKADNPISLSAELEGAMSVGDRKELTVSVTVNGECVDVSLPYEVQLSSNLSYLGNFVVGESKGKATVEVSFAKWNTTVETQVYFEADGVRLDGMRDDEYGEFTDVTEMDDDRWYSISAVKTESGVFIYTQGLFNTSVVGDPGTAIHSVWNNSTNFEFRFDAKPQFYLNVAGSNYGIESYYMSVEEVDGKLLHTFEIFVREELIASWTDEGDLQFNYAWMTPDEKAAIQDDLLQYQYMKEWGNNDKWHAMHRLGGSAIGFNDMVANLFVTTDGLQTEKAPEMTMDGMITEEEALLYGINEISHSGNIQVNVKGTVIDGDVYLAITLLHGELSSYHTGGEWYKNDNFEFWLGDAHEAIMFLNGKISLPAFVTDGAAVTAETSSGKFLTVIELYVKGDRDAYKFRMNANGECFGWNDIMWGNDQKFGTISSDGIVKNGKAFRVGEIAIDGVMDDEVYTTAVRTNVVTTTANGAEIAVVGTKTQTGVLFAFLINHSKAPNVTVNGSTNWYTYLNPELRINANGTSYFSTAINTSASKDLLAHCLTTAGDGLYTSVFEYYIDYDALGITQSDEVTFSVGGWIETGWAWLWGGNGTTMTHRLTENGIWEL